MIPSGGAKVGQSDSVVLPSVDSWELWTPPPAWAPRRRKRDFSMLSYCIHLLRLVHFQVTSVYNEKIKTS